MYYDAGSIISFLLEALPHHDDRSRGERRADSVTRGYYGHGQGRKTLRGLVLRRRSSARRSSAVNTLKVLGDGSNFTFYVNSTKVGTAKDSSLKSGSMGMRVNLKGTEVAFSNMLITQPS